MRDKLRDILEKIIIIEFLRAARKYYKLSYLAEKTGIDASLLSRYSKGLMLPSYQQAVRLRDALRKAVNVGSILMEAARGPNWVLDLSSPLMDRSVLRLASIELYWRVKNWNVDAILVPETSGVVLATMLGYYLNVSVLVARKRKTNPHYEWLEAHVSVPPNITRSLYIPRHLMRKDSEILIVDDFVRSGYTLACAKKLVETGGGRVTGVASLIIFGDDWRIAGIDRIEAIVEIESNWSPQQV